MALGNSNIDTDLVANAIGVASHDVFTLCTHNNINKGSKFKPGYMEINVPYASYKKPDGVSTHPFRNEIHDAYLDDFALYNHAAVVPGIQGQSATLNIQVRNVGSGNTGYATPITVSVNLGELDWWNKETQTHGRMYFRTGGIPVWTRMRVRATIGATGVDDAVCMSDWEPCSDTVRTATFTITPVIQANFGSQNYWIVLELSDASGVRNLQLANKDLFKLIDVYVERVFDPGMWPTPDQTFQDIKNGKYVWRTDNSTLGFLADVKNVRFLGDYGFNGSGYGEWRTNNFKILFDAVFKTDGGYISDLSTWQIMTPGYSFTYDLWQFVDIPNGQGKAEQVVLVNPYGTEVTSAYEGLAQVAFGPYARGNGSLPDGSTNTGFELSSSGCYVPMIKTLASAYNWGQNKGNIHGIKKVS